MDKHKFEINNPEIPVIPGYIDASIASPLIKHLGPFWYAVEQVTTAISRETNGSRKKYVCKEKQCGSLVSNKEKLR